MEDYGIFRGEDLIMVVQGKDKAEQLQQNYSGTSIAPVEYVSNEWVKKV